MHLWKIHKCSFHCGDPKCQDVCWLADCFQFWFVKWDDGNDWVRRTLHAIQFSIRKKIFFFLVSESTYLLTLTNSYLVITAETHLSTNWDRPAWRSLLICCVLAGSRLLLSSLLIVQWLILSLKSKIGGESSTGDFGVGVGIVMVGCEGKEVKRDKEWSTTDRVKHWLLNSICTGLGYIFGRSVSSPAKSLELSVNNRWGIWVVLGVWCLVLSWKERGCMLLITHQYTNTPQSYLKRISVFAVLLPNAKIMKHHLNN